MIDNAPTTAHGSGQVLEKKDFGEGTEGSYKRWLAEIKEAQAEQVRRGFIKNGKKALAVLSSMPTAAEDETSAPQYNIYWSYLAIVLEVVYARPPKIVVSLNPGYSDPVHALARQIVERNMALHTRGAESKFYKKTLRAVFDAMTVGRGQMWPRYEIEEGKSSRIDLKPGFEPPEGAEVLEDKSGQYYMEPDIEAERVTDDYVHWLDYLESPARTNEEVRWKAKRTFLTKSAAEKAFGKQIAKELSYSSKFRNGDAEGDDEDVRHQVYRRVEVWEIEDLEDKQRIFISEGYEKPLKIVPIESRITGFFSAPDSLVSFATNESTIPICDYKYFGHLVDKINELTLRIGYIIQAIKVVAAYDASHPELKDILKSMDASFVPLNDWEAFIESDGFDGAVKFAVIEQFIKAAQALQEQRAAYKQDFYEVSGYNEMMRGESDGKTQAELQADAQFGNVRTGQRQKAIQAFLRDLLANDVEIMCNECDPQTLLMGAGIPYDEQSYLGSMQEQAINFLKDGVRRKLSLTIETDSTIAIDDRLEKRDRIEFANMMTQVYSAVLNMVQSAPEFVEPAFETFLMVTDAFRVARPIEDTIRTAVAQYKERIANPQPPPPDPKMEAVMKRFEIDQQRLALTQQEMELNSNQKAQDAQMKFEGKMQELAMRDQQFYAELNQRMQDMYAKMQMQIQQIQAQLQIAEINKGTTITQAQISAAAQAQAKIGQAQIAADAKLTEATIKAQKDSEATSVQAGVDLHKSRMAEDTKLQQHAGNMALEAARMQQEREMSKDEGSDKDE